MLLSIDATRCASALLEDKRHNALVDSAVPHHWIVLPCNDEETEESKNTSVCFIEEKMKMFVGDEATKQLVLEVKIAMITSQWTHGNKPANLQVAVCPQTKNKQSTFNQDILSAIVDTVGVLRGLGYRASFLSTANNGVSCNNIFVRETLVGFLSRKRNIRG